ncbi:hypothetical protein BH24PSE2_BH24PSE2_23120 [soil metagenome]
MFDMGFWELLLIFVIALMILGPERLPRAASRLGRWVGHARALVRTLRAQMEEEIALSEIQPKRASGHEAEPRRDPDEGT